MYFVIKNNLIAKYPPKNQTIHVPNMYFKKSSISEQPKNDSTDLLKHLKTICNSSWGGPAGSYFQLAMGPARRYFQLAMKKKQK